MPVLNKRLGVINEYYMKLGLCARHDSSPIVQVYYKAPKTVKYSSGSLCQLFRKFYNLKNTLLYGTMLQKCFFFYLPINHHFFKILSSNNNCSCGSNCKTNNMKTSKLNKSTSEKSNYNSTTEALGEKVPTRVLCKKYKTS